MWYSTVWVIVTLILSLLAVPLTSSGTASRARAPTRAPHSKRYLCGGVPPRGLPARPARPRVRRGPEHHPGVPLCRGQADRLPALVAELVQLPVDVLVVDGTTALRAAQHATTTLPIVMAVSGDPVGAGLVASLARPGGTSRG